VILVNTRLRWRNNNPLAGVSVLLSILTFPSGESTTQVPVHLRLYLHKMSWHGMYRFSFKYLKSRSGSLHLHSKPKHSSNGVVAAETCIPKAMRLYDVFHHYLLNLLQVAPPSIHLQKFTAFVSIDEESQQPLHTFDSESYSLMPQINFRL